MICAQRAMSKTLTLQFSRTLSVQLLQNCGWQLSSVLSCALFHWILLSQRHKTTGFDRVWMWVNCAFAQGWEFQKVIWTYKGGVHSQYRAVLATFLHPVVVYPFPAPPKMIPVIWKTVPVLEQCSPGGPCSTVLHKNMPLEANVERAFQFANGRGNFCFAFCVVPNEKYQPFESKTILELRSAFGVLRASCSAHLRRNGVQFPCLILLFLFIIRTNSVTICENLFFSHRPHTNINNYNGTLLSQTCGGVPRTQKLRTRLPSF